MKEPHRTGEEPGEPAPLAGKLVLTIAPFLLLAALLLIHRCV